MRFRYSLSIVTAILLFGCSSPDDFQGEEHPYVDKSAELNAAECRWIYQQMNHYYLWRSELPDSLECDYSLEPSEFFKTLLSPKDRFSYCTHNTNYSGPTSIVFDDGGDAPYTSMTRSDDERSVLLDSIYHVADKKVGYLCYLNFSNAVELVPVMKRFWEEQIDELIVDLRFNPGGYVSVCRYLCNCVIAQEAYGHVFQHKVYNDVVTAELLGKTGQDKESENYDYPPLSYEGLLGTPIYPLNMQRVYVLTSNRTASASEAFIVCLRPFTKTIVIGEQTVGKGVGSFTVKESQYFYELHPITMRYYNGVMETTPDEGFTPDFLVSGGSKTFVGDIGKIDEPLLSVALQQIAQ